MPLLSTIGGGSAIGRNVKGGGRARRTITVTANIANLDVWANRTTSQHGASVTVAGDAYDAGNTDFVVTINSGVYVGSSSTGSFALDVNTSFNAADTVSIVNNGYIYGAGGGGGGVTQYASGSPGGGGGGAIRAQRALSVTNNQTIAGGGGGGGGGGSVPNYCSPMPNGGVGGSGGGANASGAYAATNGAAGTYATGAQCGDPHSPGYSGGGGGNGGAVGNSGSSGANGSSGQWYGASGGGAGAYINGNANVTWLANGTRLGGVS